MQEIKLPNLGEGIKNGTVVRVRVAKGETVRPQQTLIELETDKALIEVPSDLAGTVVEILVSEGEKIDVGQVILTLEEGAAEVAKPQASAPDAATIAPDKTAKPESAKTPDPEPAPISARQQAAAVSETPADKPLQVAKVSTMPAATPPPAPDGGGLKLQQVTPAAGPSTRRLARELGVELHRVKGSGRGGRVTREDVLAFVQQAMQSSAGAGGTLSAEALPDFSQWGAIEMEPLNAVRRKTAEHLGHIWPAVPLVTQFDIADITDLEAMRERFKPDAAERGAHLTLTVLLLKALIAGLKEQPRFNSSLDLSRDQLVLKRYYHIGVATDTPRGLLVPVLRDVDRKDIWQLSIELDELAEKARQGKIDLSELHGASFSLSNQGGIGGTHFTPLVNHPEVAILGVGQARLEPVWDSAAAQFNPRLVLPLALSYDHRALDGADAARFITGLKRRLEDPQRLLAGL